MTRLRPLSCGSGELSPLDGRDNRRVAELPRSARRSLVLAEVKFLNGHLLGRRPICWPTPANAVELLRMMLARHNFNAAVGVVSWAFMPIFCGAYAGVKQKASPDPKGGWKRSGLGLNPTNPQQRHRGVEGAGCLPGARLNPPIV